MKKLLLSAVLLAAFTAGAQTIRSTPVQPVLVQPSSSDASSYAVEEKTRFQACESTGNTGFFWIDTVTGDLWRLVLPDREWVFLGNPRGSNTGRKGTYQLLSDRNGGVYVLNADNGEGWWTDGITWKNIGELSRRVKQTE